MTRILAFSGKKQSGKSTHTNFIHGYQLKSFHVIQNYALTKEGNLLVETNGSSEQEPVYSKLDISRTDDEFADWASYHMWPFVKKYSFAHPLKSIAVELFGIRPEQVNGSDFDKNTKTHLRWEDMPILKSGKRTSQKKGRMTAREFLQFFERGMKFPPGQHLSFLAKNQYFLLLSYEDREHKTETPLTSLSLKAGGLSRSHRL